MHPERSRAAAHVSAITPLRTARRINEYLPAWGRPCWLHCGRLHCGRRSAPDWPSAIESDGSTITWSEGFSPEAISTVAPISLPIFTGTRCTLSPTTVATCKPLASEQQRVRREWSGWSTCCGTLKWTNTYAPGSSSPLAVVDIDFHVQRARSLVDLVRVTGHLAYKDFCPGYSSSVSVAYLVVLHRKPNTPPESATKTRILLMDAR